MARPKVTWRSRPGPEADWAAEYLGILERYGEAVADVVEICAQTLKFRRQMPTARDVKQTLRAIVERPASCDVRRLDGWTEARLVNIARGWFDTTDLHHLTPTDLAICARVALRRFTWQRNGRMCSDDVVIDMVSRLLQLWPAAPDAQKTLVREALQCCKVAYSDKTVERLLAAARRRRRANRSSPEQDAGNLH